MSIQVSKSSDLKSNSIAMLLFGQTGCGKTHSLITADKPLIIDCEVNAGTSFLKKDVPVIHLSSFPTGSDLREIIDIANSDEYSTVCIDSVQELSKQYEMKTRTTNSGTQGDGITLTLRGHSSKNASMSHFVRSILGIGKDVVVTASSTFTEDSNNNTVEAPILTSSVRDDLLPVFQIIGLLKQGEKERRIVFDKQLAKSHFVKDRSGNLAEHEKIDLAAIFSKIRGDKPKVPN